MICHRMSMLCFELLANTWRPTISLFNVAGKWPSCFPGKFKTGKTYPAAAHKKFFHSCVSSGHLATTTRKKSKKACRQILAAAAIFRIPKSAGAKPKDSISLTDSFDLWNSNDNGIATAPRNWNRLVGREFSFVLESYQTDIPGTSGREFYICCKGRLTVDLRIILWVQPPFNRSSNIPFPCFLSPRM